MSKRKLNKSFRFESFILLVNRTKKEATVGPHLQIKAIILGLVHKFRRDVQAGCDCRISPLEPLQLIDRLIYNASINITLTCPQSFLPSKII